MKPKVLLVPIMLALVSLLTEVYSQCPSPGYSDSLPNSTPIPVAPNTQLGSLNQLLQSNPEIVQDHWSEVAKMMRPNPVDVAAVNGQLQGCPYVGPGLKNWHDPATWAGSSFPVAGRDVTLPVGSKVLVSSCSVRPTDVFGIITVPEGSELIFTDANIVFRTRGIRVQGALRIGSATCRIRNKVQIFLHGSRSDQALPADPWIKGIYVNGKGVLDLFGARYYPTWTRLATTAKIGDSTILVQDIVNWQPGQSVVLTTTELKDSRDFNRNEVRVIQSVALATAAGKSVSAITFTAPLNFLHYGAKEFQAEVGLLTRNIVIAGDEANSEPTDNTPVACSANGEGSTFPCPNTFLTGFGGHVMVEGESVVGRVSGVEFFRMGQTNQLARYPIHFHMMMQNGKNSFISDSSVHRSFYRCFAIHGTQQSLVTENVAYDAIGHCYYLEDGVEEDNTFSYNLGAHVHWLGPVQEISLPSQNEFFGQVLRWVDQSPTLLNPADFSASPFYITNSFNSYIGNAASGGFSSYAFPSLPTPVKMNANVQITPKDRPLKQFQGNSGHSTAYWWASAGAIYIGGTLKHKNGPGSELTYTAGRSETRNTCQIDARRLGYCPYEERRWMRIEDTKVFLTSGRGLQHWGDRSDIIRFEVHDASMSMNVFGNVYVNQMLMECRSRQSNNIANRGGCAPNTRCNDRDNYYFNNVYGFQWYDIHQLHIVTNSTFRNCDNRWPRCQSQGCGNSAVWSLLSHSDEFVPEEMQASKTIRYENVNPDRIWTFSTDQNRIPTLGARLQNWLDIDGSASGVFAGSSLIGSATAKNWWRTDSNRCVEKQSFHVCPTGAPDDVASFLINQYDQQLESQIGGNICKNGYWSGVPSITCPIIGKAIHLGRTAESGSLDLGANLRITGPVLGQSGGWALQFNNGSPKNLRFTEIQVNPATKLIVAIPYPRGTTFNIVAQAAPWCNANSDLCRVTLRQASSLDEVKNGNGDNYFYDSNSQYLYLRIIEQLAYSLGRNNAWRIPQASELEPFTREDITIIPVMFNYWLTVQANCPGNGAYCSALGNLPVPPALFPNAGIPTFPATTSAPITAVPTTAAPSTRAPTTTAPSTRAPTTAAPTTRAPTTRAPTTVAPTTAAPSTRTPTTAAPTTAAPSTRAPTTAAPTTGAPSTRAPTTAAPTTVAPTTPAPTTPRPTASPTFAPTTPAPTTPRPTAAPTQPPGNCKGVWEQCGGINNVGAACCREGLRCRYFDQWYSQCVPINHLSADTSSSASGSPTRIFGITAAVSFALVALVGLAAVYLVHRKRQSSRKQSFGL